ncbi:hypothetical protein ACFY9Q_02640 [Streptomyces sp. NPDC012389]|uniref:hypothetical protein n=1 Tax=unclassified Streptomyces TaxID=2593676 RepID=UPI0013700C34|nr:hypothetical protein [Streptomyces sp. SID8374]MYX13527.1 hypothetical protein [Streptomyces sp. SID8374]
MDETPKTYPCCAIPLFLLLILVIVGSCAGGSDDAEDTPPPTVPTIRDPGYSDSLCEGDDYLIYDDCR